jgi:hypothetical protein
MATSEAAKCPVCGAPLKDGPHDYGDKAFFNCPRCGLFGLTRTAETTLPDLLRDSPRNAAILSYAISRTQPEGRNTPLLDSLQCKRIIETGALPTPQEQAENLVRWLGNHLGGPGERAKIRYADQGGLIGAQSEAGFNFIVDGLIEAGLLLPREVRIPGVTLSFKGWERYEALRRGAPTGRRAFMAMQYRDPILDRLVNDHFRPAVEGTGFVLRRLDDEPRAGLIDDRLRVEIQSSRFLIVDLTHKNPGAYWEAGYAEGLGKPVIYTCEKSRFHEASHFDTNHHLHVLWTADEPEAAATQLKATIRATIPDARRDE